MKKIIWSNSAGGISVFTGFEGARLCVSIALSDDTIISSETPVRADSFLGMWPVDGVSATWAETEEEFAQRMAERHVTAPFRIVDDTEIPEADGFFDALVDDGATITIDMDKAKEIHKDMLRSIRKPKLDKLDIDYMKAIESGNTSEQLRISGLKQELRDVTIHPVIELAQTPDELKLAIPKVLADN
ncbi:MAG: hypothetical protein WC856_07715 [Methylococcaceae bacterium]|jgi:hypothetical protein